MSGELLDAVQLLLDVGISPEQQITQTRAEDAFGLKFSDFAGVRCEELENPHNPKMPMRLFDAVDVAERALAVHGGPGCSLVATRAKMAQLAADRRAADERREQVKDDMAARSAQRARLFAATTPAQRLCKRLHVDPQSEVPKTAAKATFHVEDWHLRGLVCTKKPNPRNPRFAPMKLYKAEEVAARALQYGTMGSLDEPKTPQ